MLYYHNILTGVWFIDKNWAGNYFHYLTNWMKGVRPEMLSKVDDKNNPTEYIRIGVKENNVYTISEFGESITPEDAPENSVAIINISGVITKYDQYCGPAGMVTKANILQRCYDNPNIIGVVIVGESGGGDGSGMRVMKDKIAQRNKPVFGFIEDYAFSAMAGILESCDQVIANSNLAQIGSFGTYFQLIDFRKQLEMAGINIVEIYATKSTDKNQDFKKAMDGDADAQANVRSMADVYNEDFLQGVKDSRGDRLLADETEWGTGRLFFAPEALKMGLIDGIDTLENVINYFNV